MDSKYIVALELSGTQVKGAVASISMHPNGSMAIPTIDAIVAEDNTDCVQYGRVQNLIVASKLTNSVIHRLQNEPVLDDATINGAFVGIAGRSLGSEQVTAEIALPTEMVITNDILRNLFIEASKMVSQNKKVLKVLPRKFVVDNQAMLNPVGTLGHKLRGEFTLVTCNPTSQRNLDLVFADKEDVNLPVKKYIVTPLAIADMVLNEEEKQRGCVLIDLGYQTTTIAIYKDRALQYLATLPLGSHNITRDISSGLNVTMEKAESAKCTYGDATPTDTRGNDDITRMNAYVAARAYEIVINITSLISNHAGYKAADLPAGFILTGRGARLKNFDTQLSAQSKMRVRQASLPSTINFSLNTNSINPEDYMSLIAIVLRVSRNPEFESCVTFNEKVTPEEPAVEQPAPVEKPVETPPEKRFAPQPQPKTVRQVDDDDWDKDDEDDEDVETKPKKKKKEKEQGSRLGFINSLKRQVIKIVSSSDVDGDADLDQQ